MFDRLKIEAVDDDDDDDDELILHCDTATEGCVSTRSKGSSVACKCHE